MSAAGWAHRRGIARILNSSRDGAYVQAAGPRWLAERLACWAVRHSSYIRLDWQSIRVIGTVRESRWRRRVIVEFRRIT